MEKSPSTVLHDTNRTHTRLLGRLAADGGVAADAEPRFDLLFGEHLPVPFLGEVVPRDIEFGLPRLLGRRLGAEQSQDQQATEFALSPESSGASSEKCLEQERM